MFGCCVIVLIIKIFIALTEKRRAESEWRIERNNFKHALFFSLSLACIRRVPQTRRARMRIRYTTVIDVKLCQRL